MERTVGFFSKQTQLISASNRPAKINVAPTTPPDETASGRQIINRAF